MRRVVYGKPGAADQIVQVLKEGEEFMRRHGTPPKMRILVDHMSGRSDTVVEELEMDDMADFYASLGKLMSSPEAVAEHKALEERLFRIVDYTEMGWWRVV
jgi:hypothetical protein